MLCLYCKYWTSSPITSTLQKKKKSITIRECIRTGKTIEGHSNQCKRFKIKNYFFCEKLNCQKDYVACLYAHEYAIYGKYPSLRSECLKCRQYEKIIIPITEKNGITNPKPIYKLKRRFNNMDIKLKRRKKPKEIPKLKRRIKPIKLKRRKMSKLNRRKRG